jgi:hypothetical protein
VELFPDAIYVAQGPIRESLLMSEVGGLPADTTDQRITQGIHAAHSTQRPREFLIRGTLIRRRAHAVVGQLAAVCGSPHL